MISIVLGDVSAALIIHTDNRPKKFIYSVDTWLLETNSIELTDSSTNANSTHIEWTVYTRRRSILFQVRLISMKTKISIFSLVCYLTIC
jgi:hypothetical protein